MDVQQSDHLESIFLIIDDLFADEIGPVAPILCEEVRSEWMRSLDDKAQRPGLRNIPVYVRKLSLHIEDEGNRKIFLDAVFAIDSLRPFK